MRPRTPQGDALARRYALYSTSCRACNRAGNAELSAADQDGFCHSCGNRIPAAEKVEVRRSLALDACVPPCARRFGHEGYCMKAVPA
jgi:tRNA(Ile2) C34 agmatinyltransferase TiaS